MAVVDTNTVIKIIFPADRRKKGGKDVEEYGGCSDFIIT